MKLTGTTPFDEPSRKTEVLPMLADYTRALERRGSYKHVTTVVNTLARMLDGIGAIVADDVTVEAVDFWLDGAKVDGASTGTLNHYVGYIRGMFRWAEEMGRIRRSPLRLLRKRKGAIVRRRQANTPDEMRRILEAAACGKPYEYPATMLCCGAGLRQSEALRLRWGDLDLAAGLYTLIGSRQKNGKDSTVPLLPALREYLAALKTERAIELGRPPRADELVVHNSARSGRTLSKDRKRTLSRAGLPYAKLNGEVSDWHSMRHSFITALGDVDIRTKQMLARHADITTTAKYDHVNIERQRRGLDKLPEFMPAATKRAA